MLSQYYKAPGVAMLYSILLTLLVASVCSLVVPVDAKALENQEENQISANTNIKGNHVDVGSNVTVQFGPYSINGKSVPPPENKRPGTNVITDNNISADGDVKINIGAWNTFTDSINNAVNITTPNNTKFINTFYREVLHRNDSNPNENRDQRRHDDQYNKIREKFGKPNGTLKFQSNTAVEVVFHNVTTNDGNGEAHAQQQNEPSSQTRLSSNVFYSLSLIVLILFKSFQSFFFN